MNKDKIYEQASLDFMYLHLGNLIFIDKIKELGYEIFFNRCQSYLLCISLQYSWSSLYSSIILLKMPLCMIFKKIWMVLVQMINQKWLLTEIDKFMMPSIIICDPNYDADPVIQCKIPPSIRYVYWCSQCLNANHRKRKNIEILLRI